MSPTLKFNSFDVAEYRGRMIERLLKRRLNKHVYHYRIVGYRSTFTSIEAVTEEVDYLIERKARAS